MHICFRIFDILERGNKLAYAKSIYSVVADETLQCGWSHRGIHDSLKELRQGKSGHCGFRTVSTQSSLYGHRRLETRNFGFKKKRDSSYCRADLRLCFYGLIC